MYKKSVIHLVTHFLKMNQFRFYSSSSLTVYPITCTIFLARGHYRTKEHKSENIRSEPDVVSQTLQDFNLNFPV